MEEFPRRFLADLCVTKTGVRDPRLQPDTPFRYVDISAVDSAVKAITAPQTLLGKDAPSRARKLIRAGDILVSTTRPNLNTVAMVPEDLDGEICSTGFCVLRASSSLDRDFLFLFVQSPGFIDTLAQLVTGALYPAVTDPQVLSRLIPLPPPLVQRRLVEALKPALEAAAGARRAAEERVTAVEALVDAHLREAFSERQTKLWPLVILGELAETCSGSTPSRGTSEYFGGTVPWVKTGELKDGVIDTTEEMVTDLALERCALPRLPVGTLLVAMYGQGQTRGRTGLLACEATTNQACFAILPKPAVFSSEYLQLWFRASYGRLRSMTENRGGNQPNLNGVLLRRLEVPLPPLAVQEQIASTLSARLTGTQSLLGLVRAESSATTAIAPALLRMAFNGGR